MGVASIGASVGLHVWRGELGDRFIDSAGQPERVAQQWNDVRVGVWTTAALGGAATSAAMPLLLPDYARTPWWGWTLGAAVGSGLTGYAIYEGVTMTSCPEPYVADQVAVRSCVARGQEAGRVALALVGGCAAAHDSVGVSVSATSGGAVGFRDGARRRDTGSQSVLMGASGGQADGWWCRLGRCGDGGWAGGCAGVGGGGRDSGRASVRASGRASGRASVGVGARVGVGDAGARE